MFFILSVVFQVCVLGIVFYFENHLVRRIRLSVDLTCCGGAGLILCVLCLVFDGIAQICLSSRCKENSKMYVSLHWYTGLVVICNNEACDLGHECEGSTLLVCWKVQIPLASGVFFF